MKKDYLYVKCWNEKGKYVGVKAINSFSDLKQIAITYPKFEYIN